MSNEKVMENVEVIKNAEVVKELPKITLDEFKEKVTVKKYVPLAIKNVIVDLVYKNCVIKDEENGIYYIDSLMRDMAFNFALLQYYTDFYNVYENGAEYDYDELAEIGVFEYLKERHSDMETLDYIVYIDFDKRVEALNGAGACLHRTLNRLFENAPDLSKITETLQMLPTVLNGVDKDVLKIFAQDFKNGKVGAGLVETVSNVVDINKGNN